MTDHLPPLSDDDLSAAIDGDADPAITDRIAADPAAQARMAELQGAARALAEPVTPLADDVVDDLVARAMAVDPTATADAADSTGGRPPAPRQSSADERVVPITRARRNPGSLLAVAAIVVLLGIGLALVWQGTHTAEVASKFDKVGSSIGGDLAEDSASGGSESAPNAADRQTKGTTPRSADRELVDLGRYDSVAAFRTAFATASSTDLVVASQTATPGTSEQGADAPTATGIARCAAQVQVTFEAAKPPSLRGFGTIAGRPVYIYVLTVPAQIETDDGPTSTTAGGKTDTLVAAVGRKACDSVSVFIR